jgi:lipoprotein-releasing system permease protein
VLKSEAKGKKVSRPIVRISIISISLAIVVNLITIAVVTGFQHEVRKKVAGFGSHILITNSGENSIFESDPILKNQDFYPTLAKEKGIASIDYVAYKPILLQANKKENIQQEITGAVLKGVDQTYNFEFYKNHLKAGRLPKFNSKNVSYELLISKRIAQDLNLSLNEKVAGFFVKNQPIKRLFTIVGIYETGLEEFDKKFVLGDIQIVQQLNDWGIQTAIRISDTLMNNELLIKAEVTGGNGNYSYDWGNGFERYAGFTLCPTKDTLIRLIVAEKNYSLSKQALKSDTAYLKINVNGATSFQFLLENDAIQRVFLDEAGNHYNILTKGTAIECQQIDGSGTSNKFVGGFEVNVDKWEELPEIVAKLKKRFDLIPTKNNEQLSVKSIIDTESDIFIWLGFLDLNVLIIVILMLVIGIINMGSALLVLILVRTNFIGIFKAMGANNWTIRKIFLIQAGFLILKGMIIGNVIGLVLCGIQYYFGIITLNPEVYYLNKVPIELTFSAWVLLNFGTLFVCLTALLIPSFVITKIQPIKAIRFN